MKNKITNVMAAVMAAIFLCCSGTVFAELSNQSASKDYRNMLIMNRQGITVNKPIAQFAAKRVVNGDVVDAVTSYAGYDCTTEYPTLVCYVGDTLKFEDLSRDTNQGGYIAEWDWQHSGDMGEHYNYYKKNPVDTTEIVLKEPGETIFHLCVRNNQSVKNGCCDPWSENGNHQVVGTNRWFPKGAYWYFTGIRIVVKPIREAIVHVRYWDAQHNKVFYEEDVNVGQLLNDGDTVEASVHIPDWEGYQFSQWNVQMMDGTIHYSGNERDVKVGLTGWAPEKYLNVEFYPYMATSVEVRYWDTAASKIIHSEMLHGDMVVNENETKIDVNIQPPEGYEMTGWNVQFTDGYIQYTGTENPTTVILNGFVPKKYLNVECTAKSNTKLTVKYIDLDSEKLLRTETILGENAKGTAPITIKAELDEIPGYMIEVWHIQKPDGTIETSGVEDYAEVVLTENIPHKILLVECFRIWDDGGDDEDDDEEDEVELPDPTITVKPSGVCDGVIEWSETDYHVVYTGNPQRKKICNHTFEYKSVLTASASITPDVLKSGYGFEVDVNADVNTSLVSNTGGCSSWGNDRKPLMYITNPTKATVYISWDMSNRLGTQSKAINMESNGTLKWRLPVSNVSEAGARKIYTPVELPGTAESPVTHSFEIYISGGGFEGVEFCQKLIGNVTINGDMYSDDFSGSD